MQTITTTESSGFFYVDGIPTKGIWIDLDLIESWADIEKLLLEKYPACDDMEIGCADIEGIAKHFYSSNSDYFDLSAWVDFKDNLPDLKIEIIDAYLNNLTIDDLGAIEEAYCGEFPDHITFAWDIVESTELLSGMDESLQYYFDIDKFSRHLMYDHFESNGHYFKNL